MITPRRTRLVRAHDLHAFRAAIRALNPEPGTRNPEPIIVVPTRSAARVLGTGVTRDELYEAFRSRLSPPPRRLSSIERDVMAQASARAASDAGAPLAFQLRPGLVAEILRFYDLLKRQSQSVDRFEELIDAALGSNDLDRAAARMRQQTRFLAAAFREYERRVAASGACDEHRLRDRLIADPSPNPVRAVVVTVADWIVDDDGLFVADFDLLARVPGLESLDIVATDGVLRSGFHERIHTWLPGLEETDLQGLGIRDWGLVKPVLQVPAHPQAASNPQAPPNPQSLIPNPFWTHRDREEELIAIARMIRANERRGEGVPFERTAVVFKQPLPYLYLAPRVFGSAGIPVRMFDTLPLAAEPTAAAFDLLLDAPASDFNRESLVALLRSPHFAFGVDRASVSRLDRALSEARYLGGLERLEGQEGRDGQVGQVGQVGMAAAIGIARALEPLTTSRPASAQIATLLTFWSAHSRPITDADPFAARERRARAAIVDALEALAAIHAAQDDPDWTVAELSVALRRLIEEQTFVPAGQAQGIRVVDDQAARYGDFDDIAIVGVIENEWPAKPRRNIFYPPSLLKSLGWPTEKDRRAAADAQFLDLVASASRRTTVSTFTLEDDALVVGSLQLDELPRARLSSVAADSPDDEHVFLDEALSLDATLPDRLTDVPREWALMRSGERAADDTAFHGTVGELPARDWSISAIETYLGCPFKFFAQHVLKLEEEPDDEEVMDPRRQGRLVHQVFEDFFREWQDAGHETIVEANLDAARALFADVVERNVSSLSEAEAGLERTRLLGSPAAAGLGEAVFRMEAERPTRVVERLLEHPFEGEFTFRAGDAERRARLKGKADRIDLLADGTFRLIDYKLGWPPDRARALQLPIYSLCAEQRLQSYHGRRWVLGDASYLAFKGPRRVVPLFNAASRDKVLSEAQERLVTTLDAIARGDFPPTPDDVYRCETCSFAGVCRKDYVGDV